MPIKDQDAITCLIFKDNSASRSIRISITWIKGVGWTAIFLTVLFLMMLSLTIKLHLSQKQSSPAALHELENKLAIAQESNQALQKKLDLTLQPLTATTSKEQGTPQSPGNTLLFSALTPTLKSVVPKTENELAFRLVKPSVTWRGQELNFKFFIQYVLEDGKTQHGRFVVLARGPDALLGYPEGVLRLSTSDALIDENQGETFSVGRIREVSADFAAPIGKLEITEFQALIFDSENNLLWTQTFPNPKPFKKATQQPTEVE